MNPLCFFFFPSPAALAAPLRCGRYMSSDFAPHIFLDRPEGCQLCWFQEDDFQGPRVSLCVLGQCLLYCYPGSVDSELTQFGLHLPSGYPCHRLFRKGGGRVLDTVVGYPKSIWIHRIDPDGPWV